MRVRRFAPRDSAQVVDLWRACFPNDPPRNDPAIILERKCARDPELIWVATDGDAVIGAAMAGYDGVRGWLYHIAVDPGRRREGIGKALVQRALAELDAIGCPKVNLQVRHSNPEVAHFYESLGFTEDKVSSYGYLFEASAE